LRRGAWAAALAALLTWSLATPLVARAAERPPLHGAERAAILAHGPWPAAAARDGSNRVQHRRAASDFGKRLFFDARLSRDGSVSCASCHQPERALQDGRATPFGLLDGQRNTPGLDDVAGQRWFGWDGAHDSLWSASLAPLLNPAEMGSSATVVARRVREEPALRQGWRRAFDVPPPADDEAVLVGVAKALAAWQAVLVSPRTPFDDFRDALARGDRRAMARYPVSAQRGLQLFVGRGRCSVCHAGARFSHGEFADIGIPFFVPGGVDAGRFAGIETVRANPYNRLGRWADDGGAGGWATRHLAQEHRHFGEFKVPGLRGVARTAPYMHDGSLATLADVVRHYSELNEERLHADGERILRPLRLSAGEQADLLAFLASLSPPAPRKR